MNKKLMTEMGRVNVEEFQNKKKLPIVIVLDNVRSLHNVGSIFRTADAFAVEAIYLCGITGTPPHREIEKTALGATNSVKWKHFATTTEALEQLKSENYEILAIEQVHDSTSLLEFVPSKEKKFALIFGNEVDGVSTEALALTDTCLEIPQFGTKHSFNVAVSIGIVLWDIFCKTRN